MEHPTLIDLSIKYGLNADQVVKLSNIAFQADVPDLASPRFKQIADFLCESKQLDLPMEEIIESLRLQKLI